MILEARFPIEAFANVPALGTGIGARELVFRAPVAQVNAQDVSEVLSALRMVEEWVRQGFWAAGYVAYEAAPAFDQAMRTHALTGVALLAFGIFQEPEPVWDVDEHVCSDLPARHGAFSNTAILPKEWEPTLSRRAYTRAVRRILEFIAAGDTYQVNFTFPMRACWKGDSLAAYHRLVRAQPSANCAFVRTDLWELVCASPELFFELVDGYVTTRPMKGTAVRGLWAEADEKQRCRLAVSPKERAENVMIVDLLRNDLGRVAEIGTVRVDELFALERYPTVWQMTSTIRARTCAFLTDLFGALFPCGSVTGAPKIRTMEIIRELESAARWVYCGAIGWVAPAARYARFSVPIRTIMVNPADGEAIYSVGSGIVADSNPNQEYEECLAKAHVLSADPLPEFDLLETLRYDENGYAWLEEHLARLKASALYFGRAVDESAVRRALEGAEWARHGAKGQSLRVRLTVRPDASLSITAQPLSSLAPVWSLRNGGVSCLAQRPPVRVALAPRPVRSCSPLLFHKTTARAVYEEARAARPDMDDVLLWNEAGELTESTIANLVVVTASGELVTPPIRCGLLGGVLRNMLVSRGEIRERPIMVADLARARTLYLINSVRGWMRAELAWSKA